MADAKPSMLGAMLRVLWAPRDAFDAVIARGGGFNWIFPLLALEMLIDRPETAAILGMRLGDAPFAAASTLVRYAVGPAFLVFAAGVALHYASRGRENTLDMEVGAGLVTLAWVPHTVWLAISVVLARVGLDHPLLPHHPVRALAPRGDLWEIMASAIEIAPVAVFTALAYRHVRSGASSTPRGSPRWAAPLALSAAAAVILTSLATNAAYVRENWESIRPVGSGDTLPQARLSGLSGPALDTESLRGKVVLVDFWATWCGPCRQTLPTLQSMYEALEGEDFVLLSVNVEPDDPEGVRDYLEENELSFPVYVDDRNLQARMHVDTLPTMFLVDRRGVIREMHVGAWGVGAMRKKIERLLAESGSPGAS